MCHLCDARVHALATHVFGHLGYCVIRSSTITVALAKVHATSALKIMFPVVKYRSHCAMLRVSTIFMYEANLKAPVCLGVGLW